MTPEFVTQILRQMLETAFWVSAPLLIVAFVAGIVISLVQILTSIQDTGFNTIPRLAALLVALLISMPWMMKRIVVYTTLLLGDLSRYAR